LLSQNLVLTWVECIGPVIGGFVTEYVGWHWIFWILNADPSSYFCEPVQGPYASPVVFNLTGCSSGRDHLWNCPGFHARNV
jgi:hypothetical protein